MNPTKKNKPQKHDSQASKDRIKSSAIELFSKIGYKSTTTRMIAKKSNLNLSLISRYFGSKEKLFATIVKERIEKNLIHDLAYSPQSTLSLELSNFLNSCIDEISRDIKLSKIILCQAMIDQKYRKMINDVFSQGYDERLFARLESLQKNKMIPKKTNIRTLTMTTSTFLTGLIFSHITYDLSLPKIRKNIADYVDLISATT